MGILSTSPVNSHVVCRLSMLSPLKHLHNCTGAANFKHLALASLPVAERQVDNLWYLGNLALSRITRSPLTPAMVR